MVAVGCDPCYFENGDVSENCFCVASGILFDEAVGVHVSHCLFR